MQLRRILSTRKLRFQVVTSLFLLVLIVLLTATFLFTARDQFEEMAEESARIIFSQVSEVGVSRFRSLGATPGRHVRIEAASDRIPSLASGPELEAMERRFMAALDEDHNVYAYYLGLENGDFFQVVAIRDSELVRSNLSAPANAVYGVRSINRPGPGQDRIEHWRFLDQKGMTLATRSQPAHFDPRSRPWYQGAMAAGTHTVTAPYMFQSAREPGISSVAPLTNGGGVMAADISVRNLDDFLSEISKTPKTVTALVDGQNRLMGYGGGPEADLSGDLHIFTPLAETGNPVLEFFDAWTFPVGVKELGIAELAGVKYVLAQYTIALADDASYRIIAYAPMSEFSGYILKARDKMLLIAGLVLVVALPLTYLLARRSSEALNQLADHAQRIQNLDFSDTPTVHSAFQEIDTLGTAQQFMRISLRERTRQLNSTQARLEYLVETGLALAMERDRMALLRKIVFGGRELLNCSIGTLFLMTESGTLEFAIRTNEGDLPSTGIPLHDPETGEPNDNYVVVWAALHNQPVVIDDVYSETRFDLSGTKRFSEESGFRTVSMLTVPLSPRDGEVIGVLQYLNALDPETNEVTTFNPELVRFLMALAAEAAVALDNHQLVEAQQQLVDAMIQMIAGAIDAKSPYTGGHCERVPELAIMLAEEASRKADGPLAEFHFETDEEWREFRIGAWLHDCGKVTTPEHVVDKATKLEVIYNRIHEIRMRFEVLLRDAMIERLETIAGGEPTEQADQRYAARKARLIDDFAFVADCNLGGEFMAPEKVERLKEIAEETWQRHFDDRLGLGHEELRRYPAATEPLPAMEKLLADKPQHVQPRPESKALDPKYGFKLKVPQHLYNQGELYNLGISRGTLTEEDRFKINEHIIQTIVMLENMPFPKNLKRVPEYAGTHHETLVGSGYPRKLGGDELSVPARIMAIADIFEALTAADRPYKKAKTLSESIQILARFKQDGHIDPDLFELFLASGVYRRYAEMYLLPEQIDAVEIEQYLG